MRTTICSTLRRIASKFVVLPCLALLAVGILPKPASAQGTCLQDEFNLFNGDTPSSCAASPSNIALGCSANDVSVSTVLASSVHNLTNPELNQSCFQNLPFDFVAEFEIITTSSSRRSNVGLYFATLPPCSATVTTNCNPTEPAHSAPGGKSGALCGKCADNIISPRTANANGTGGAHFCPGSTTLVCGSDNYHEGDTANPGDNCGDTSSNDVSTDFPNDAGAEGVIVEVPGMFCGGPTTPCASDPSKQCLVMNYCTSWQIPGGVNTCTSTQGTWPYVNAATPPNGSKCNCNTVQLPITPISVTATAQKACNTSITTGTPDFTTNPPTPNNCDEGIEGTEAATYYVNIAATASGGSSVIVDQICDTAYGTLYDDNLKNASNQRVFPTCAAGTVGGTLSNNTCASGLTFTPPATGQCHFTAPAIGELKTVSDQVSASGHSSITQTSTFTTGNSNQVMVHSSDAPTSATATKSYVSTIAACATVRLSAVVANTSAFDENETLSALSDTVYGDLTSCKGTTNGCTSTGNPNILGTTCGVAAGNAGLGTLSGVNATTSSCVASSGTPPSFNSCNGGGLPATLAAGTGTAPTGNGGVYQCEFDVQFCGGLDANGCISAQPDQVNATLKGDEATDSIFTQHANTLNVKACIATTAQ